MAFGGEGVGKMSNEENYSEGKGLENLSGNHVSRYFNAKSNLRLTRQVGYKILKP